MNHLDEGTIHAWLDGALDAPQSREIEAHVADCAVCSAAVAEARGLIAGASRILGALDDVPAGVIPGAASMRAPATPATNAAATPATKAAATPPGTAARLKARGQRRVTQWVSGIAAVLIGAVVLSTAHRADRLTEVPQSAADAALDSAVPASAREEAARAAESFVQPAVPPAAVPAPQREVQRTSVASTPGNAATAGRGAVTGSAGAAKSRDVASAKVEEAVVTGVASERPLAAGVQVRSSDTTRLRTLGDRSLRLSEVVVTSAPAEAATTLSDADLQRVAGCYRFEAPVENAQQRTASAEAVANRERRARQAAPAQAPPAAAVESRADFSGRSVALIRLDTTVVDGLRRAVRMPSDSTIGSWSIIGDSIRIDLGARGIMMLTPQRRIDCP